MSVKGTLLITEISYFWLAVDVMFMHPKASLDTHGFFLLMMVVIFNLPRAEEICL